MATTNETAALLVLCIVSFLAGVVVTYVVLMGYSGGEIVVRREGGRAGQGYVVG